MVWRGRRPARVSKSIRRFEANSVRVPEVEAKATQVQVCLGLQDQSALNWSPRMHPDSIFDNPYMVGKLI